MCPVSSRRPHRLRECGLTQNQKGESSWLCGFEHGLCGWRHVPMSKAWACWQRLKSDGFLILHDLSQYGSYRPSKWICFWIPTLVPNNTFIISFQYFPYERVWWFKWECIALAKILEHLIFSWWHCLEMLGEALEEVCNGGETWKLTALPYSYFIHFLCFVLWLRCEPRFLLLLKEAHCCVTWTNWMCSGFQSSLKWVAYDGVSILAQS